MAVAVPPPDDMPPPAQANAGQGNEHRQQEHQSSRRVGLHDQQRDHAHQQDTKRRSRISGATDCRFPPHGRENRRPSLSFQRFVSADQRFGDLHRIQGRALTQVVANHEQRKAMGHGRVVAHATDEHRILPGRI